MRCTNIHVTDKGKMYPCDRDDANIYTIDFGDGQPFFKSLCDACADLWDYGGATVVKGDSYVYATGHSRTN